MRIFIKLKVMQIYWILVIFFLFVEVDVTLSSENSAHCEITRDEDDEYCGAICYPIVKPLLRYAAICQGKDSTISELKDQIREKDVYSAKLESKLQLSMASEVHASQKMEVLKVQLNLKEMLKHMKDLREQSEAEPKSWDQRLKDKETELLRKEKEMLKIEQEMKDKISNMEKEIQARDVQIQSKDKSFKELKELKDISEASSCLPFVNSNDIHTIRLPGMDPFDVPCNSSVSGSGWTVIQRRVNGNENFNRNWNDYKGGFGDLRENFFLGLDNIHQMTQNQPHELYIQLGMVNGYTSYARYDDFIIGSENEDYELKSLGKYSGTAGNSLAKNLKMKFSTLDRDNDHLDYNHCAKNLGGGWWFFNCGDSSLNGKYYEDGIVSGIEDDGINWGSFHNNDFRISLTFTQMMIRPKAL